LSKEPIEATRFFKKVPIKLNETYTNKKYKTRALLFILDKGEYNEELKHIRTAARRSANREPLRFGIVSDVKLIRKYKQRYGNLWFTDAVALNTMVVKRYDGQIAANDLLDVQSEKTI